VNLIPKTGIRFTENDDNVSTFALENVRRTGRERNISALVPARMA
jgi:hypothetical protein